MFVYVVIENGTPYPYVYTTYDAAANAVRAKHKQAIDEDLFWKEEDGMHSINVLFAFKSMSESLLGFDMILSSSGLRLVVRVTVNS